MTEQEPPQTEKDSIHVGDITDGKGIAIGPGARATVVEGDLVISIGQRRIAIPRIVQIAIIIVTSGIIFLVITQAINLYRSSAQTEMEGDFNVAVAQFQVVGEGKGLQDATALAQSFANAIDREMQGLATELAQRIEVRSPGETGTVKGKTEEQRAESAQALAEAINADVVVYGTIEVDGVAASIKPEFFVRAEESYAGSEEFATVAEVTGQYRMGSVISIDKVDNKARRTEASSVLAERARALTFITYGLADYVVGRYKEAESQFGEAQRVKAWDNPDVISVMLGNAALKQHDWVNAEAHYRQALETNPLHSRAYIGLGSVLYEQALGDIRTETYETVDSELLNQCIETYQRALDPGLDHPPLADVSTKAHFSLGQAYLLGAQVEAEAGNEDASERALILAIQAFETVIQDYGDGDNARVKELAAYAHARLGLIYRLTRQFETAITEYEAALTLLPPLDRVREHKASYEAALGDIYVRLNQPSEAVDWYERAVRDAPPGSDWQKGYRERLDALR
jgi:tetratricopeptide (TPR) repeat protein